MLLNDYCFEINTREIKKKKEKIYKAIQTIGLIAAVLHSPGMHFMRTTPKIFALADGRTVRVSTSKINFKIRKKKISLHNGGCVEKETNYHFNCAKIRYLSSRFFRIFFFHKARMDNGIIDLWDPST